jgi:hypothetical protein
MYAILEVANRSERNSQNITAALKRVQKAAPQNKEVMVAPLDNAALRTACHAMRTAITTRARGDIEKMRAPMRALVGLEQAAFNAPQNCGWLRKRQIELHEALAGWSANAHRLSDVDECRCFIEAL